MIQYTEEEGCPVTFYPAKNDEGKLVCLLCAKLCMCGQGRYRPTTDCVTVCPKFHPDKYEYKDPRALQLTTLPPSSVSPSIQLNTDPYVASTWFPASRPIHDGRNSPISPSIALGVISILLLIIVILVVFLLYFWSKSRAPHPDRKSDSKENEKLLDQTDKKPLYDNIAADGPSDSSQSSLSEIIVKPATKTPSPRQAAEHSENNCGLSPARSHRFNYSENGDTKYQEALPCQATPSNTGPARRHCVTCTCEQQRPQPRLLIGQHDAHSTPSINNVPVQTDSGSVPFNPSITIADQTGALSLYPGQTGSLTNIKAKHKKPEVSDKSYSATRNNVHINGSNTSPSIHYVPLQPEDMSVISNPSITIADETRALKLYPDKTHSAKQKAGEAKDQSHNINVYSNPHQLNEGIAQPDEDEEETKVKVIDN